MLQEKANQRLQSTDILDATEAPRTTVDAFKTLKTVFNIELGGSSSIVRSQPIETGGKVYTAVLSRQMATKTQEESAAAERMLVIEQDGENESRRLFGQEGLISFNASIYEVTIDGSSILINNSGYPFAGWTDVTRAEDPEEFRNRIHPLAEALQQKP